NNDLHQQDGVVMLASEQQEAGSQKRGIAGQADPGRPRPLGMAQPVDAVLEPVLGDVPVNQRIAGYMRESNVEEKPQRESGQCDQQEVLPRLPEHAPERQPLSSPQRVALRFQHVANIAAWSERSIDFRIVYPEDGQCGALALRS